MILRRITARNGGQLWLSSRQTWKRPMATANFDHGSAGQTVDAINQELEGAILETKSLETRTQSLTERVVPLIDGQSQTSKALSEDGTVRAYRRFQKQQALIKPLGTEVGPHYDPRLLVNNPPRPSDISLELLLASQTHLGHKTSHWNPSNSRYIFGIRQGIHIISLDVTAAHLRRACRVVRGIAERGGLILFVGTRPGQDRCVVKAAELSKGCHLFERWTPGSITNGVQILGRCKTKTVNQFDQEVYVDPQKLQNKPILKPDVVVVLNPLENWVLLHECGLNAIPTIGIIDTNADPTWVTYPIPANDDSLRCVQMIAGVLGRAGEEGQAMRKKMASEGIVPFEPNGPTEYTNSRASSESAREESFTEIATAPPGPREDTAS